MVIGSENKFVTILFVIIIANLMTSIVYASQLNYLFPKYAQYLTCSVTIMQSVFFLAVLSLSCNSLIIYIFKIDLLPLCHYALYFQCCFFCTTSSQLQHDLDDKYFSKKFNVEKMSFIECWIVCLPGARTVLSFAVVCTSILLRDSVPMVVFTVLLPATRACFLEDLQTGLRENDFSHLDSSSSSLGCSVPIAIGRYKQQFSFSSNPVADRKI